MTEERRAQVLPLWAGLASVIAIYLLTENFWKAALIGMFVGGSAVVGYGTQWVLKGSFAIAVVAIAVALGRINGCNWPAMRERPSLLLERQAESLLGGRHLSADGPAAST